MTIFESLNDTADKATESAEKYVKTYKEYLRLKVFQQLTTIVSWILKFIIIGGFLCLAIIFMAVAGALALGNVLHSLPLGCAIIAFVFVILTLIGFALRKKMDKKIIVTISSKFFD